VLLAAEAQIILLIGGLILDSRSIYVPAEWSPGVKMRNPQSGVFPNPEIETGKDRDRERSRPATIIFVALNY